RPLARPASARNTALIPRDHSIFVSKSGLVTVTGGKWTTYRKMAEQAVDRAATVASLGTAPCRTREVPLHGSLGAVSAADAMSSYGSDAEKIRTLAKNNPQWQRPLHPALPYTVAEV